MCLSSAPLDLETRIRPAKSTSRFLSTVPLSIYFFKGFFLHVNKDLEIINVTFVLSPGYCYNNIQKNAIQGDFSRPRYDVYKPAYIHVYIGHIQDK